MQFRHAYHETSRQPAFARISRCFFHVNFHTGSGDIKLQIIFFKLFFSLKLYFQCAEIKVEKRCLSRF